MTNQAKPMTLIEVLQQQTQIDEDGVMVGVNRQALDEAIAALQSAQGEAVAEIEAKALDAARYRWLCEQVAFGDWSIGIHETIDKFGATKDTYIGDKNDADVAIDAAMAASKRSVE